MLSEIQRNRAIELSDLLERASRSGEAGLSLAQAERLAELYRLSASDLLRSRRRDPRSEQTLELENLIRRAYPVIYAHGPRRGARALWLFLSADFPVLVRREARLMALSACLLLVGALCGALVMSVDPTAAGIVLPDMHQEQTPAERVQGEARGGFDANGAAEFSSFLFTHNIQVTFLVFALGLSFGIGTAAVLFWNGIPLGALGAQYFSSGNGLFFLAWILPHGVVELTVVTIAGTAGFVLARGLLRPGQQTRRQVLLGQAKIAVKLVLGGMPLLVLAGLVEGTVSQLHPPQLPYYTKLTVALAMAVGCYWYLVRAGRVEASSTTTGAST